MERRTSERLVNLTIALLTARQFVPRERLRELVEAYHDLGDEAFERQFERDKDTLRGLGVPIETGTDERYFSDEPGYRIRRADFELPPLSFDDDEVGVLVSAAQVWQQASTAESTTAALAKLWASGIEPDPDRLAALRPHISAKEAAWQPLWDALQARQVVRFTYHALTRLVRPWGLAWRRGAWYVAGFDETRQAPRLFKLSRLESAVEPVGEPGAYDLPGVSVDAMMAGLEAAQPDSSAVIEVRAGTAPWLTRRSEPLTEPGEWRRWRLPYAAGSDVVDDLAMAGPDVRVVEPSGLAAALAEHHAGLLANLGSTTGRVVP